MRKNNNFQTSKCWVSCDEPCASSAFCTFCYSRCDSTWLTLLRRWYYSTLWYCFNTGPTKSLQMPILHLYLPSVCLNHLLKNFVFKVINLESNVVTKKNINVQFSVFCCLLILLYDSAVQLPTFNIACEGFQAVQCNSTSKKEKHCFPLKNINNIIQW